MLRINNLKINGIFEHPKETKYDCKRKVLGMLQNAGIQLHPKAITITQRTGNKSSKQSRAILATFHHLEDKEFVLAKASHIQTQCSIKIEEDFLPEIEANRKTLRPIVIAANRMQDSRGYYKYRASLQADTLIVNNKRYTVESMKELPNELHLEKVSTPTKNGITAFFSKDSPFSNHHPSPMKIENRQYTCNEQYYMERKALTFGDTDTAAKIMATSDPGHQKALGSNITNFKPLIWREMKLETMSIGLRAKFEQNPALKQTLLDTNTNTLIEASPGDRFWGAGMGIYHPQLWQRNSLWGKAQNHLGRLLMDLRRELKQTH